MRFETPPPTAHQGPDGLPFEFYKKYSSLLAPTLQIIYNSFWHISNTHWDFNKATLILIPKPNGDPQDFKNWRPISLLNCDRKIFSKIIANRLQSTLSHIISPWQFGFMKKRHIQDPILSTQLLLEWNRHQSIPGALILLDQEKAYDRVEWTYLQQCLRAFGFPPRFTHYIQALHQGLLYTANINGHLSEPFQSQCGLPQGDPLSPLLYNITLEPLQHILRQRLQGIQIPKLRLRTLAFADDMLVSLGSQEDANILLHTLHLYENASNAKLNLHKSATIHLSPTSPPIQTIGNLTETQKPHSDILAFFYTHADSPCQRAGTTNNLINCRKLWLPGRNENYLFMAKSKY